MANELNRIAENFLQQYLSENPAVEFQRVYCQAAKKRSHIEAHLAHTVAEQLSPNSQKPELKCVSQHP